MTRCWRAWGASSTRPWPASARPTASAATSSARTCSCDGPGLRTRSSCRASRGPDRERRGAQHRGVAGRRAPAPRGRQRRSRAPGGRRAHVRRQAHPLHGAQPGRRGAAAHHARQAARARRALLQRRRAGRRGSRADLGLGGEALDEIARAAELHDIGKVGIPDAILNKPSTASPTASGSSSTSTPSSVSASSTARPRCARWRGWSGPATSAGTATGYPDGLRGEEIPLGARIVAVCDAYEAMTADRSYRAAVSHELGLPGAASARPAPSSTPRSSRPSSPRSRPPARSASSTPPSTRPRTCGCCWARGLRLRRPEPQPPALALRAERRRRHLHRLGLGDDVQSRRARCAG